MGEKGERLKLSARSVVLALAALIAVGSLAWLTRRGEEAPVVPRPVAAETGRVEVAPAREAVESARGTEATAPSERTPAPIAAPGPEAPPEAETRAARVLVLARSRDDGMPLAGVRVGAFSESYESLRQVDSSRGGLGEAAVTDAEGRAELAVEPGTFLRIMASDAHHPSEMREVDPLAAGDSVECVFELPTREDVTLHGRLVDDEDDAPLRGSVTVEGEDGRVVATDPGGHFELSAGSWQRLFASARADGYARAVFAVTEGHADPARPLVVRLSRSATVEALVRDRAGNPIEGARVELSTESYRLQLSSSTTLEVYLGPDPTWKGKTDASGRTTIPDLVPRVPLRVVAVGRSWPRREEPEPLVLEPGEHRRLELALGAGATILGTLEDASGAPIPRRWLWRMAPEGPGPGMLQPYGTPAQKAYTDAQGRFRFEAVPAGSWWIGPAPSERGSSDDVPPIAQVVTVSDELAEIEIVVRVERALFLKGRVFDPAGRLAMDCSVSAHGAYTYENTKTDERGEFTLGPLAPGRWKLEAGRFGRPHAVSEPIEVDAGSTGIVLRLRPGGSIAGEAVDRRTGQRCECDLFVSSADPEAWHLTSSGDGTIRCEGLLPGTYTLAAKTRDGRIGTRAGVVVEAGACTEGVRVEVAPGSTLGLRYSGSAKAVDCQILLDGIAIDWTSLEGGRVVDVIVPTGAIEVRWRERDAPDVEHVEKIDVGAGERVERTLTTGS